MKPTRRNRRFLIPLALPVVLLLLFYSAQHFWAHRNGYFAPDYPRIALTENTDYETLFLQTGLGRPAVDKLLAADDFASILCAQDCFFQPQPAECTPLLGWFTREDRLAGASGFPLIDLRPGDILLTLSTHTAGWRHGHAALVIQDDVTLESIVLGTNSKLVSSTHWNSYSNYAVLRVRNTTPDLPQQVVEYSQEHLLNVPYRLSAGLLTPKPLEPNSPRFGLHCSYLVWYAWNQFGFDLNSDGGRLVTAQDLLSSDLLEVVQLYGMDPRLFLSDSTRR